MPGDGISPAAAGGDGFFHIHKKRNERLLVQVVVEPQPGGV